LLESRASVRHLSISVLVLSALALPILASAQNASMLEISARPSSLVSPAIVIGFVGGFIAHNAAAHGGVQLADRLRKEYPDGVHVEVFENRRGDDAYRQILKILDADHDQSLSHDERRNARIILYGHSWGACEAIEVARRLERDGIPVLLTIQVDSVRKLGEDDSVIPANVAEAANFYQPTGFVRGRPEVRAADPSRTRIVGNFKFDYTQHPVGCVDSRYPWYARAFEKPHVEIECDPAISDWMDALIHSALPQRPAP